MGDILEWRGDAYQVLACCGVFILLSWVLTKLLGLTWKRGLRVGDPQKGHRWFMTEILDKPTYCNFCERPLVRGGYCENCGISVHEECIDGATKRFACKVLVLSKREYMNHQWVRGNLPLCSTCSVCGFHCGTEPRLCDLRCVWCQDKTHDYCLRSKSNVCDFGKYKTMMLPPHCISLTVENWKSKKRFVVREVSTPPIKNWSPLLVFANRKSGDNEGERLLMAFKNLLNPVQVVDLHDVPPESALEFCKLLPNHRTRILVCGGDGSVGWVLGALDKVKLKVPPYIGILPLGTGNDLARVLGWGSGYTGEEDVNEVLTSVMTANVTPLDRWKITIESNRRYFDVRRRKKRNKMAKACIELGAQAVGLERTGKSIIVGCMDNTLVCYSTKGKKLWTVYLLSSITTMSLMDHKARGFKAVMVAMKNGEVRIYKEKYIINTIKMPDAVTAMKFGRFGREESALILITKGGGLYVKILKRTANFEGKDLTPGPPQAQSIKLNVPKKTKLFVDQTLRERDSAGSMHRMFQHDLYLMRLMAARAYVSALQKSLNPISSSTTESLKLSAHVERIGPAFKLTVNLQNISSSVPSTNLLITFQFDDSLYALSKPCITVPLLVPGLMYTYETLVECISDKGISDSIKVFVLHQGNSIPVITAVINMPVSEALVIV